MKTATFSIFAKLVVLFLATFITTTLLAPLMLKVEHANAMNWYVQCYFIHIAYHDISIEVYITRVHMHLYYFIGGGGVLKIKNHSTSYFKILLLLLIYLHIFN